MKASIPLLIAAGIAALPAIAQIQTAPQPPSTTDLQPQQDVTPSSGAGAADTPAAGNAGTVPDTSGGTDAMRSEAGAELRAPTPAIPLEPVVQGDVTYLCGGVGVEEGTHMKREAKEYDLMLTFAARNGAYLADVDVAIADSDGNTVLQANCGGPIMLVDLPGSGSYRVHAEAAGYTVQRTVSVKASKKSRPGVASASLVWPQQAAEGAAEGNRSTGDSGGRSGSDSGAR